MFNIIYIVHHFIKSLRAGGWTRGGVLAALLLASAAAPAANQQLWEQSTLNQSVKRGEQRVGVEAGYRSFAMLDNKCDIIGFDVDLARLMAKYLGVKVRLVNTQWD